MPDDVMAPSVIERIARIEERIATLAATIEEMRHEQRALADTVARASGGLRVLLMFGGLAGLISAWRVAATWATGLLPHMPGSAQ